MDTCDIVSHAVPRPNIANVFVDTTTFHLDFAFFSMNKDGVPRGHGHVMCSSK